jgi:hypothetical protein
MARDIDQLKRRSRGRMKTIRLNEVVRLPLKGNKYVPDPEGWAARMAAMRTRAERGLPLFDGERPTCWNYDAGGVTKL